MGEVIDRLASRRLVTIIGPGGIGKTTLAHAVAARAARALRARAPTSSTSPGSTRPDAVAGAIAGQLGFVPSRTCSPRHRTGRRSWSSTTASTSLPPQPTPSPTFSAPASRHRARHEPLPARPPGRVPRRARPARSAGRQRCRHRQRLGAPVPRACPRRRSVDPRRAAGVRRRACAVISMACRWRSSSPPPGLGRCTRPRSSPISVLESTC